MQLFNLLPTLLLAEGAYARPRGCYSGGDVWPKKSHVLKLARQQCNEFFTGDYAPNTNNHVCLEGGPSIGTVDTHSVLLTFRIHRINGQSSRYLPADECYNGLEKVIMGCKYGGDVTFMNWRYVADPNRLHCNVP